MRGFRVLLLVLVGLPTFGVISAAPRTRSEATSPQNSAAFNEVVDRIIKREQDEMAAFALYRPLIESYFQELKPDKKMGLLPDGDHYFLGQADLSRGITIESMLPRQSFLSFIGSQLHTDFNPNGFLQMAYVDRNYFDKQHYTFHYVGRDFLGDVRCFVFDLQPGKKDGRHFKGRIWVEDRDYTIVRFSGTYVPQQRFESYCPHFDSWRLNVQPDLWLPAYVFSEELNPKPGEIPRFKGQTRFWGYSLKLANHEDEFSDLFVDPSNQVQDESAREQHDRSPIEAEREFQRQSEDNSIDTLARDGLIAPEGEVDKVLNTVLNNLEVTNNIEIEPEPRCRVLLTSNIELFSIGHTIVLSRGLLDVVPDEATLAVMLAQELSDAMLMKQSVDQFGFSDVLQTPTSSALKTFSFKDSREDWEATGEKTLEILRNSPYRSKLSSAALFLEQLNAESKAMPHLLGPHLGNRVYPLAALINSGPRLQPDRIDQVAALPMGSRVKLDPWSDRIELNKAPTVPLLSAREKMPFEITPFMPYLTRYSDASVTKSLETDASSKNRQQLPPDNRN